ncbi:MlaD family protein [Nocardia yamanashiensis]|uniref:MlaD family protein n=1 Tax=Nocardia yamanashiensis TaxID=209247 RepID=UPI001E5C0DDF|nr:MlaD family protein [Nocardia yamanashiensis]UGT38834.1 MlaD family protein [Nocardia yamanashiensis]
MPTLKTLYRKRFRLPGDRPVADAAASRRRELRQGLLGAGGVVVLLAACGVLYVLPLGQAEYTADMAEAGSLRVGEDVRMAGINVGTVKSLELHDDRVRLRFTVEDGIFVGDQSSLDVRMLTIAGGHYLAITSAGDKPLGGSVIPRDRVRLPYSLGQSFQDAVTPVRQVNGQTLRENLAQLQTAITDSPDGLRRMGGAMDSLVSILDRQNADVSRALAISQEYLTAISESTAVYGALNRELTLVEDILSGKRSELRVSLNLLHSVLSRVAAVEPAYAETLKPLLDKIAEAVPQLESLTGRLDQVVNSVQGIGEKLRQITGAPEGPTVDQSGVTVSAQRLCVPVPGQGC